MTDPSRAFWVRNERDAALYAAWAGLAGSEYFKLFVTLNYKIIDASCESAKEAEAQDAFNTFLAMVNHEYYGCRSEKRIPYFGVWERGIERRLHIHFLLGDPGLGRTPKKRRRPYTLDNLPVIIEQKWRKIDLACRWFGDEKRTNDIRKATSIDIEYMTKALHWNPSAIDVTNLCLPTRNVV